MKYSLLIFSSFCLFSIAQSADTPLPVIPGTPPAFGQPAAPPALRRRHVASAGAGNITSPAFHTLDFGEEDAAPTRELLRNLFREIDTISHPDLRSEFQALFTGICDRLAWIGLSILEADFTRQEIGETKELFQMLLSTFNTSWRTYVENRIQQFSIQTGLYLTITRTAAAAASLEGLDAADEGTGAPAPPSPAAPAAFSMPPTFQAPAFGAPLPAGGGFSDNSSDLDDSDDDAR